MQTSRYESVPVSVVLPPKVSRSTMAAQRRGSGVAHAVAGYGGLGAQRDEQVGLPVPLSPIRYSGRPFLTQSQVAWVWMTTGSTLGLGD